MRVKNPAGEVTSTYLIGRDPHGRLTSIISFDDRDQPNRRVFFIGEDDGWSAIVTTTEGARLLSMRNFYSDDGFLIEAHIQHHDRTQTRYESEYTRDTLLIEKFRQVVDGVVNQMGARSYDYFGERLWPRVIKRGRQGCPSEDFRPLWSSP